MGHPINPIYALSPVSLRSRTDDHAFERSPRAYDGACEDGCTCREGRRVARCFEADAPFSRHDDDVESARRAPKAAGPSCSDRSRKRCSRSACRGADRGRRLPSAGRRVDVTAPARRSRADARARVSADRRRNVECPRLGRRRREHLPAGLRLRALSACGAQRGRWMGSFIRTIRDLKERQTLRQNARRGTIELCGA